HPVRGPNSRRAGRRDLAAGFPSRSRRWLPSAAVRPYAFAGAAMNLARINGWSGEEARVELLRCCASRRWAEAMEVLRPFAIEAAVIDAAGRVWWELERSDWLEAFAAHPRIGDLDALRARFAATAAWSISEQAGVCGAPEDVLRRLADGNRAYEERFGYIFI